LGPDSGAVLAYLDRVPDAAYRPESEALARASAACRNESDRASLRLALEGRPRWAPSRSGLGARVYAPGWTNLPREVRRALLPGTELDLRAAHLAIFVRLASDAGQAAPLAANALASGDAWGEIASHSGRDRDEVKRALCAAINGRTRAGWVWASPEVRPLARALAPWLDEIEAGRLALRLSDEQLHDELTKRELRLIRPVYDVAARYPGVTVALHLHDGVTVTGEESAIAAFVPEAVAAVARSAAELGVRSTLVRK